jgi:predicted RNA-binding Zn ribbon-like protein
VGGAACLDLVNTVGGIRGGTTNEKLGSYSDLLEWAVQGGMLSGARAGALRKEAETHAGEAEAVLCRAKALREAMHGVFHALMHSQRPPAADLALVNEELGRALAHARINPSKDGFAWGWSDELALDAPLYAPARSAGELLVSDELSRIRECASESCGWLFLDVSRNASRRWCDMRGCGNRAKVRRYRRQA